MKKINYKDLRATYKGDNPKIVFKVVRRRFNLKWVAEDDKELFYPFNIPFADNDWTIYVKEQ